jgi:glutamate-ammonia-ligase adenylyltransferase
VKQRIETEARGARRNVKLGPGGIREAEFVVQALQALYGGRHASLRTPNTGEALVALAALGILNPATASELGAAYALLRRVENGIQMAEDRQLQELPEDPAGRRRLARRLGYADPDGDAAAAALFGDLDAARERVRAAFASLLLEKQVRVGVRTPDAARWAQACRAPGAFATALLAAAPPALLKQVEPGVRRLVRAVFEGEPGDAAALAGAPDAAPALALFLAADPDLVSHLLRRPALLAAFAPAAGAPLPELELPGADEDLETALDGLRLARRDAFVYAAARRLRGELSETELSRALTAAAERVLAGALALALRSARGRGAPPEQDPARLCVLGLGKLGSEEMSFHSDLDLVFLYEPGEGPALQAQEWAARLAQKLIHYLTTPTSAGRAYEVVMRLRPSGHGGPLVASLDAFRHYHERRAQVWEAQALLRARPVAGDPGFCAQVIARVHSALFEFLKYPGLVAEILRMRSRIENERARTGAGRLDLKYGPGGIVDAEFLAQYLALREGPRRPELRDGNTPRLLAAAGAAGLLRDSGDVLAALETLRRVESSLRLVLGRAESTLELASPAAALVAELSGMGDVETLADAVRTAQAGLRAVFSRELRA